MESVLLETNTLLYMQIRNLQSELTHAKVHPHKVQESASRTAIGAVLPKGLVLASVLHHVHVSHLQFLSIQSLAGAILLAFSS